MASAQEPVRRHVLALMEGTKPDPHTEDIVHQLLEMPLNHLGMVVRRHYIGNGPPPDAWLDDTRAVLTYFGADTKPVEWLWPWLKRVVPARKLRVVHFGDFGPLDGPELAPWLERFGLEYDERFIGGPLGIQVTFIDDRACTFEADPRVFKSHRGPRNRDRLNRVWITTRTPAESDGVCTPVVTGAWGGLALDPWTLRQGSDNQGRRWHLNPFRFLREALGLERVPAPHPSVLNGRRMYFCQVDGDGFESLSTIRPRSLAARVLTDEVFLKYALPFTVSVIVRSLTPDYLVKRPTPRMKLAREILNLRNIEPASHGVLHTLKWQQQLKKDSPPRSIMWYPRMQNYEYGQVPEVRDSIRFINERLMEGDRRCQVMLWTGEANPLEGPLQAAVDARCWNLNGGVYRWDERSDSVGFVSPWSRRVARLLQIYAGAANENDFEGFFDTMPGAFAHIDKTIERTGHPRILKPANVYIHFYSASSRARLDAVHTLIRRWALAEPTAPVFASSYAAAVDSAVNTARVSRTKEGWVLRDFGACRTARIDHEPRDVDWRRSTGLLGARRVRESLYLHLAGGDADVVLTRNPARHPHVREANCVLEQVRIDLRGVQVTATAHNRRVVVFAGFEPGATLTLSLDGKTERRRATQTGTLTVELPVPGTTRIEVR